MTISSKSFFSVLFLILFHTTFAFSQDCTDVEIESTDNGAKASAVFESKNAGVVGINFTFLSGNYLTEIVLRGDDRMASFYVTSISSYIEPQDQEISWAGDRAKLHYNLNSPEFVITELERHNHVAAEEATKARKVLSCLETHLAQPSTW